MTDSFSEARDRITAGSWLDDLYRASLSAAAAKFDGIPPAALGEDASAAFARWLERNDLLSQITKDQCAAMAWLFISGYVLGAMRGSTDGRPS